MKMLVSNSCVELHTDDKERGYSIPYVHVNRKQDVFKTSVRNIEYVLKLAGKSLDEAPAKVKHIVDKERRRRDATAKAMNKEYKENWLYKHQQMGIEIAKANDRFCFFYDTRTGKTPMSLAIINEALKENPDEKWLVLCPLILIEQAWLPDAETFFPNLKVVNLHATTKAKRLEKFKQQGNVYLMNIEAFIKYQDEIEKLPITGCIVDESSTMKSTKSKFGKAAVKYSMKVKRWYLLSGAPAPNGEWEYYRQLQSVDFYGVHSSWTQFKLYFFNNVSYTPQFEKLVIKEEKKQELQDLIKQYAVYVDKEDVLTLPGRSFDTVPVEVPDDLMKHYKHLKDQLYLEVGDDLITAASAAAKINKLRQVTSGFVINTGTKETHLLSMYKFNKLMELLRELGDKQVLVWCFYRKEFEIIKKLLGERCALVYGAVNNEDKNVAINAFKAGEVQYLIANPASIDKGVTLVNAHTVVYFSLSHSYELWKQSIDRVYGDVRSQKHFCSYYLLMANKTIDKVLFETVTNKADISYATLNYLKKGDV